jgi:energy-coupling factor transport system substrate-specific component
MIRKGVNTMGKDVNYKTKAISTATLTLIPVGVAVNLAVGTVVQIIKLPVFLDSIGTVLVAVLAGAVPGIITGVIAVFVGGLIANPVLPWFVLTAVAIGWFSGFCSNRGYFKRLWTWTICGILMGVIAGTISAPVVTYLFGGVTQSGSAFVVAYLISTGRTILRSAFLAGLACDPMDKLITFIIVWGLVRGLPTNLLANFPKAIENTGRIVGR